MTPSEIKRRARRINRKAELPRERGLAFYRREDDWTGESLSSIKNRDRQIGEAIIGAPLYCASPLRISDAVLRLRRDHGWPIETEIYSEGAGEDRSIYGIYYLASPMVREDAK